jgi:hypothetical protein
MECDAIRCFVILLLCQNGGTNFHHQSECSVGIYCSQQYVDEAPVITELCVSFSDFLLAVRELSDNYLSCIPNPLSSPAQHCLN